MGEGHFWEATISSTKQNVKKKHRNLNGLTMYFSHSLKRGIVTCLEIRRVRVKTTYPQIP